MTSNVSLGRMVQRSREGLHAQARVLVSFPRIARICGAWRKPCCRGKLFRPRSYRARSQRDIIAGNSDGLCCPLPENVHTSLEAFEDVLETREHVPVRHGGVGSDLLYVTSRVYLSVG